MPILRLLRAHPTFRRLWIAGAVSLVGDGLSLVAVAMLALEGAPDHTFSSAR